MSLPPPHMYVCTLPSFCSYFMHHFLKSVGGSEAWRRSPGPSVFLLCISTMSQFLGIEIECYIVGILTFSFKRV